METVKSTTKVSALYEVACSGILSSPPPPTPHRVCGYDDQQIDHFIVHVYVYCVVLHITSSSLMVSTKLTLYSET